MTKRIRLMSIVISIVLLCSAVIGLTTYLVINEINKGNALQNSANYTIGNLLSGNNAINADTVNKLTTMLGNFSGERNAATIKTLNTESAGNPIVFQMGEVNGNPIYWQVVYQTGDAITIWMTEPYTAEWYNDEGYAMKNPDLAGYETGIHDEVANYSASGLRDVTNGIYTEMSTNFPIISTFITSPSNAVTDTSTGVKGISWQTTQPDTRYSSNYYAHHQGLQSVSNTGYYTSWPWPATTSADNPYNDEFWIPSHYEVITTSSSSSTFTGGKWGLTSAEAGFSQTSNGLNGVSGVGSNCWLRSGSR